MYISRWNLEYLGHWNKTRSLSTSVAETWNIWVPETKQDHCLHQSLKSGISGSLKQNKITVYISRWNLEYLGPWNKTRSLSTSVAEIWNIWVPETKQDHCLHQSLKSGISGSLKQNKITVYISRWNLEYLGPWNKTRSLSTSVAEIWNIWVPETKQDHCLHQSLKSEISGSHKQNKITVYISRWNLEYLGPSNKTRSLSTSVAETWNIWVPETKQDHCLHQSLKSGISGSLKQNKITVYISRWNLKYLGHSNKTRSLSTSVAEIWNIWVPQTKQDHCLHQSLKPGISGSLKQNKITVYISRWNLEYLGPSNKIRSLSTSVAEIWNIWVTETKQDPCLHQLLKSGISGALKQNKIPVYISCWNLEYLGPSNTTRSLSKSVAEIWNIWVPQTKQDHCLHQSLKSGISGSLKQNKIPVYISRWNLEYLGPWNKTRSLSTSVAEIWNIWVPETKQDHCLHQS